MHLGTRHLWGAVFACALVAAVLGFYPRRQPHAPRAPYPESKIQLRGLEHAPEPPAAHALPAMTSAARQTARLAFAGDIMPLSGHSAEAMARSLAPIASWLESFDWVVANLEFPIHPRPSEVARPGDSRRRFNGRTDQLEVLKASGIDMLVTANNHACDQGPEGIDTTLDAIAHEGLVAVGTARAGEPADRPRMAVLNGIRVAFFAYTFQLNPCPSGEDPSALPIHVVAVNSWSGAGQEQGKALFRRHASAARQDAADFLVAYLHWGEEWSFVPLDSQRRAAQDLIDVGFDVVVGAHSHVLGTVEIYHGKLIVYSLGSLLINLLTLEARLGAVLDVTLQKSQSTTQLVDYGFLPTLVHPPEWIVRPVDANASTDDGRAWSIAQRLLGALRAWPP